MSGLRAHNHETLRAVDDKCREKIPVAPVEEGQHVQGSKGDTEIRVAVGCEVSSATATAST